MPAVPPRPSAGGVRLPDAARLRVLMIGLNDAILTGQGGGDVRERHVEYARRVRHLHMIVYSPRGRGLAPAQIDEHLTVYPSRSRSRLLFIWDAVRIGARICREHGIDVITTQDPFSTGLAGLLLRRRCGAPLDVQNHSDFFDNAEWIGERPLRYGLSHRLGAWLLPRADTHRVLTGTEKAKYLQRGIPAERVVVLPTPTRVGRFSPDAPPGEQEALRASLGIPSGAPVLLWVGRAVAFKRIGTLLSAFALVRRAHPGAHLVLVGDFSTQPDLRERAARPDIAGGVRFAGRVAHADLPALYRLADVYVHTSVYEGLGKVMIEAAATGRPVVSTRTAGGMEIVEDGVTGLLAAVEDPADIAARIVELLDDPARARQMGAAARARVLERFDHERNLDAVVATWQRAAALGRRRG